MNKLYDVAIVGAGPAGSVFARELAKASPELKILLINGQDENRKKPCGGLLAPDAQKVLAEFDLTLPKNVLADPQIFAVETIDLVTKSVRYYQRHYLNMDRYKFDMWLISLVPEWVDIITDRCIDIAQSAKEFTLTLSCGTVSAKSVVGADGGGSVVRRKLIGKMAKQYVSIQEWYENKGQRLPYYSCIFDRETSDSCSWTIHKDGYVIFGGAFEPSGCREAFERQKRRFEAFVGERFGEVCKSEACLVTSPRKSRDFSCGKERVYLLGEAAGFISASSFEGISCAILSGRILAKAFCEGKNHTQIVQIYRRKTTSLRLKLLLKTFKRWVLCTPLTRHAIMKSGIRSMKKQLTDE